MMRTNILTPTVASFAFIFSMSAGAILAQPVGASKTEESPVVVERKLHGAWNGPPCGGNWVFKADGTFAVEQYSPGGNSLTGIWELCWNALPPTLVLTLNTSDAPERMKVGERWELKITQLNDETLAYVWPDRPERPIYWNRVKK